MKQLGGITPKLVMMFASRDRDQRALNRAVRERLPKGCRLVGATTAGELDNTGIHYGTVVLGALYGDFDVGLGLGTGLSADAVGAGATAIRKACEELGVRQPDLDPRKYVGLVIDDGFRYKKEELLLGILEKNQTLVLVGGGASDDNRDPAKQSARAARGRRGGHRRGARGPVPHQRPLGRPALALVHPHRRADDDHQGRRDAHPRPRDRRQAGGLALRRDLSACRPDELEFGTPKGFAVRPTALRVGREYFIRAPWKPILEDNSILFANLLEEGSELELMKIGDMAGMTRAASSPRSCPGG